jgi:hypothetical protein
MLPLDVASAHPMRVYSYESSMTRIASGELSRGPAAVRSSASIH